jgi:phosphoribosylformylglycinamidine synthase subunit PurL
VIKKGELQMINSKDYGLSDQEVQHIIEKLNREPNHVEMGIFSAMWSEHCSYKHTKSLLKGLPTQSEFVVQGPGENAGVVKVDEDWNVVFKIESHNHPSYIAPYEGAATGVGGLLRDVMAMGARPVGVKPLLRSGSLDEAKTSAMIDEICRGAEAYAKECSVTSLGKELFTHPSFTTNPLVNVIVLGLAKNDALMTSGAGAPGNVFVYFGKPTGAHGVDGASFASKGIDDDTEAHPPAGDPVAGKELMDATLVLIEKGLIEGLQDMGAAGLTSSSFEMADKSGNGFILDLDALPKTSDDLSAYELLLSETQERMLASVKPEKLEEVVNLLKAYPALSVAVIGEITVEKSAQIKCQQQVQANLPVDFITDGFIQFEIPNLKSLENNAQIIEMVSEDDSTADAVVKTVEEVGIKASELQPTQAGNEFGSCSGIKLPDCGKTILLRTISNGANIVETPYQSVYEMVVCAYEDLKAQGAQPLALSDCINCGNPDDPQIAFQIREGLRGLSDACKKLEVPVIGGNVSLYNETNGQPILSQFIVGMVGVLDTIN